MTSVAEFWSAARAAVPSLPEQQPTDDREFFEQPVHVGRSFEHAMPMVCERLCRSRPTGGFRSVGDSVWSAA